MKLKNSHILLIVISIFLLISIGSVCASDVAMDADTQLADAESNDVVLTDGNTTQKIATTVVSKNVKINEGETAKLDVNVKDKQSNNVNFTKNEIKVNEGNKTINFNYADSNIILNDKLSAGNHSLIINYLGNEKYTNSSTKIILSIAGDYKLSTPTSVNINSTKKTTVPVKFTDSVNYYDITKNGFTLTASYKDGNDTINKTISEFSFNNGNINFNYGLSAETATLIIKYKDENRTVIGNTTLKRIYNANIITLKNESDYSTGNFTFKLVDVDTGDILADKSVTASGSKNGTQIVFYTFGDSGSLNMATTTTLKSDSKGIITLENKNFYPGYLFTGATYGYYAPAGTYSLVLKGSGDVSGSKTTSITVNHITISGVINPYDEIYGSGKKLTINVTNTKNGEAMKGISVFFNVTDSSGKEVNFTTTGANNTTTKVNTLYTNEKGIIELPVSNLVGTFNVFISINKTDSYNGLNKSGEFKVSTIPVSFSFKTTSVSYGNAIIVKVTNKNTGKAVSGAYALVQIDNKADQYYLAKSNSKGEIEIRLPLGIGKHKLSLSGGMAIGDNKYSSVQLNKQVTVKKATAKITAPKITAYYKSGKKLVVKVVNAKTKKPMHSTKVNVNLFISNTKYYPYVGTTGANGKISLIIDLNPGTYKVRVTPGESKNYTGNSLTTKVVVKKAPAKLTPKKLTAKKGESKTFKVTVKNTKTKKVISGVKVKIKVYTGKKSKTYTVKTNAKGIASLNVKSLKVGTHKVVVNSGNKYVTAKAAKSSIKITKA